MSHLVGPLPTLILAVGLLVLVGSLPSLPPLLGNRGRLAPLLVVVTILVSARLLWLALERPGVLTDEYPSRIARYGALELNGAVEPTVLIIDGGSYVINGVDVNDLMEELRELGHPARAVRLAAGAANHFERFRMQQRVVERLQGKRPNQRWVFLAEVQFGYDSSPVAQLTENPKTERLYEYLTLPNAWFATKALRSRNVKAPEEWRDVVYRSALINAFNVGAFLRLMDENDVPIGGGHVAARKPTKLKLGDDITDQIASLTARPNAEVFPWLKTIRERRIRALWSPYLDEFAYFGLPTTAIEQLNYVRKFCTVTTQPCVAPADEALLKELNDSQNWRDRSHMSKKGSRIYSRWLARELVRKGLVP